MSKEAMKLEMVDDEGENRAVRMFLALYGGACGVTAEQMRKHLKMAGFDGAWPEWANDHDGHLTKAGAQLWIRHLFALAEQPAQQEFASPGGGYVPAIPAQRQALAEQPVQPEPVGRFAKFTDGIWREITDGSAGQPLYTSPPAQQEPVALPEGKKLILVDGSFDDLMYWLERCEYNGHLENCPDLVEPWENFSYEPYTSPPAQQEPVAKHYVDGGHLVYLTVQRPWFGLTDEEIESVWKQVETSDFCDCVHPFARAIETTLRSKNT